MFALPHLHALRLSGTDAIAFAQSQLSADVERAEPNRWHTAAWCNAQGRSLAVVLFGIGIDRVDLVLPAAQADDIATRLKLYMLRRKVSLTAYPHVGGTFEADGDGGLSFDAGRRLAVLEQPGAVGDSQQIAWRRADLRCALPWLAPETAGRHLPQSLGLDALGGISYEKGCFPGQEIIARIHFLGRPPRRLSHIHIEIETPPAPATAVESTGGKIVGEVIWALPEGPSECSGLAVIGREVAAETECRVAGSRGRIVA